MRMESFWLSLITGTPVSSHALFPFSEKKQALTILNTDHTVTSLRAVGNTPLLLLCHCVWCLVRVAHTKAAETSDLGLLQFA